MQRNAEMKAVVTDYSQAKVERARTLAEEKRRDMQLLQSYDPWGKPGGGAPTVRNAMGRLQCSPHALQGKTALVSTDHSVDYELSRSLGG